MDRGLNAEEAHSFSSEHSARDNQLERATQFLRDSERSAAVGASA
jgi:hypothetical protein